MGVPARIGRYTVERELGRGGMGRVYLARDAALDRRVAVKVLPDDVAGDPARLQRFTREARTLASLNHPGIVTIYSVEDARDRPRRAGGDSGVETSHRAQAELRRRAQLAQLGALVLGRPAEALDSALRAVELNPLSVESLNHVSQSRLANGDLEEALRVARSALAIQSDFATTAFHQALALYHLSRFREAASILETLVVPWTGTAPRCVWALAERASGNLAAVHETLAAIKPTGETASVALLHAALGQQDRAFDAFAAIDRWDYWPALFVHHYSPDVLGPLRNDPRWNRILGLVARDWGVSREEASR